MLHKLKAYEELLLQFISHVEEEDRQAIQNALLLVSHYLHS